MPVLPVRPPPAAPLLLLLLAWPGAGTAAPVEKAPEKAADKARKPDPKGDAAGTADPFAAPEARKGDAKPASSYEDLLKDAVPVSDLATLIEPLFARCEEKDDVPRRQCEGMRTFLLNRLRGRTFVAVADTPPDTSPYDAAAKEIELEAPGCLACAAPPMVAGEPRYLATRPPSRIVAGRAPGLALHTYQLPMESRVRADRFLERVVPRLKVEVVFRVGPPFGEAAPAQGAQNVQSTQSVPIKGVQIVPLAHRVFDRCTGQVVASLPESRALVKVKPDRSCPRQGAEELSQAELLREKERAALPERLSPREVDAALQPVQERIHECYVEFQELGGTARVQLVLGGEGKLTQITLKPPYDQAPIGLCIKSQLKAAVFPKFRGEPMRFDYAFQVN